MVLGQYGVVLVGSGDTGSVWGGTGWYVVVLVQYNLVLLGIKWYWVSKVRLCLYNIEKKRRLGRLLPIPDILTHTQTTEYRATQLG